MGEEGFAVAGVEGRGCEGFVEGVNGLLVEPGGGEGGCVLGFEGGVGRVVFFDHLAEEVGSPEGIAEGIVVGDQEEVGEFGLGDGIVFFDVDGGLVVVGGEGVFVEEDENFGGFDERLGAIGIELDGLGEGGEGGAHLFLAVERLAEEEVVAREVSGIEVDGGAELLFGFCGATGLEESGAGGGAIFGIGGHVGGGGEVVRDGVGGVVLEKECVADGGVFEGGVVGVGDEGVFEGLLGFGELLEFEEGVAEGFEGGGVIEVFGEGGAGEVEGFLAGGGIGLGGEEAGEVVGGSDPGVGVCALEWFCRGRG